MYDFLAIFVVFILLLLLLPMGIALIYEIMQYSRKKPLKIHLLKTKYTKHNEQIALQSFLSSLPTVTYFDKDSTYNIFYKNYTLMTDILFTTKNIEFLNVKKYAYCCDLEKGIKKGYSGYGLGFYGYDDFNIYPTPYKFKLIFNSNDNTYKIYDITMLYIITYLDNVDKLEMKPVNKITSKYNTDFIIYKLDNKDNYIIKPNKSGKYLNIKKIYVNPEKCHQNPLPDNCYYYYKLYITSTIKDSLQIKITKNNKSDISFGKRNEICISGC